MSTPGGLSNKIHLMFNKQDGTTANTNPGSESNNDFGSGSLKPKEVNNKTMSGTKLHLDITSSGTKTNLGDASSAGASMLNLCVNLGLSGRVSDTNLAKKTFTELVKTETSTPSSTEDSFDGGPKHDLNKDLVVEKVDNVLLVEKPRPIESTNIELIDSSNAGYLDSKNLDEAENDIAITIEDLGETDQWKEKRKDGRKLRIRNKVKKPRRLDAVDKKRRTAKNVYHGIDDVQQKPVGSEYTEQQNERDIQQFEEANKDCEHLYENVENSYKPPSKGGGGQHFTTCCPTKQNVDNGLCQHQQTVEEGKRELDYVESHTEWLRQMRKDDVEEIVEPDMNAGQLREDESINNQKKTLSFGSENTFQQAEIHRIFSEKKIERMKQRDHHVNFEMKSSLGKPILTNREQESKDNADVNKRQIQHLVARRKEEENQQHLDEVQTLRKSLIIELEEEVNDLESGYSLKVRDLKKQVFRLSQKLEDEKRILDRKCEEIDFLDKKLCTKEEGERELREQFMDVKARLDSTLQRNSDLVASLAQREAISKKKDQEIMDLFERNKSQEDNLELLTRQLQKLQVDFDKLLIDTDRCLNELRVKDEYNEALSEKVDGLCGIEEKLTAEQASRESLEFQVKKLNIEVEQKVKRLKDTQNDFRAQEERHGKEKRKLKDELVEMQIKMADSERRIKIKQNLLKDHESHADRLFKKLCTAKKKSSDGVKISGADKKEIKKLQKEVDERRKTEGNLRRENWKLKAFLHGLFENDAMNLPKGVPYFSLDNKKLQHCDCKKFPMDTETSDPSMESSSTSGDLESREALRRRCLDSARTSDDEIFKELLKDFDSDNQGMSRRRQDESSATSVDDDEAGLNCKRLKNYRVKSSRPKKKKTQRASEIDSGSSQERTSLTNSTSTSFTSNVTSQGEGTGSSDSFTSKVTSENENSSPSRSCTSNATSQGENKGSSSGSSTNVESQENTGSSRSNTSNVTSQGESKGSSRSCLTNVSSEYEKVGPSRSGSTDATSQEENIVASPSCSSNVTSENENAGPSRSSTSVTSQDESTHSSENKEDSNEETSQTSDEQTTHSRSDGGSDGSESADGGSEEENDDSNPSDSKDSEEDQSSSGRSQSNSNKGDQTNLKQLPEIQLESASSENDIEDIDVSLEREIKDQPTDHDDSSDTESISNDSIQSLRSDSPDQSKGAGSDCFDWFEATDKLKQAKSYKLVLHCAAESNPSLNCAPEVDRSMSCAEINDLSLSCHAKSNRSLSSHRKSNHSLDFAEKSYRSPSCSRTSDHLLGFAGKSDRSLSCDRSLSSTKKSDCFDWLESSSKQKIIETNISDRSHLSLSRGRSKSRKSHRSLSREHSRSGRSRRSLSRGRSRSGRSRKNLDARAAESTKSSRSRVGKSQDSKRLEKSRPESDLSSKSSDDSSKLGNKSSRSVGSVELFVSERSKHSKRDTSHKSSKSVSKSARSKSALSDTKSTTKPLEKKYFSVIATAHENEDEDSSEFASAWEGSLSKASFTKSASATSHHKSGALSRTSDRSHSHASKSHSSRTDRISKGYSSRPDRSSRSHSPRTDGASTSRSPRHDGTSKSHISRLKEPSKSHRSRHASASRSHSSRHEGTSKSHSQRPDRSSTSRSPRHDGTSKSHISRLKEPSKSHSSRHVGPSKSHSSRLSGTSKIHISKPEETSKSHSSRSDRPSRSHSSRHDGVSKGHSLRPDGTSKSHSSRTDRHSKDSRVRDRSISKSRQSSTRADLSHAEAGTSRSLSVSHRSSHKGPSIVVTESHGGDAQHLLSISHESLSKRSKSKVDISMSGSHRSVSHRSVSKAGSHRSVSRTDASKAERSHSRSHRSVSRRSSRSISHRSVSRTDASKAERSHSRSHRSVSRRSSRSRSHRSVSRTDASRAERSHSRSHRSVSRTDASKAERSNSRSHRSVSRRSSRSRSHRSVSRTDASKAEKSYSRSHRSVSRTDASRAERSHSRSHRSVSRTDASKAERSHSRSHRSVSRTDASRAERSHSRSHRSVSRTDASRAERSHSRSHRSVSRTDASKAEKSHSRSHRSVSRTDASKAERSRSRSHRSVSRTDASKAEKSHSRSHSSVSRRSSRSRSHRSVSRTDASKADRSHSKSHRSGSHRRSNSKTHKSASHRSPSHHDSSKSVSERSLSISTEKATKELPKTMSDDFTRKNRAMSLKPLGDAVVYTATTSPAPTGFHRGRRRQNSQLKSISEEFSLYGGSYSKAGQSSKSYRRKGGKSRKDSQRPGSSIDWSKRSGNKRSKSADSRRRRVDSCQSIQMSYLFADIGKKSRRSKSESHVGRSHFSTHQSSHSNQDCSDWCESASYLALPTIKVENSDQSVDNNDKKLSRSVHRGKSDRKKSKSRGRSRGRLRSRKSSYSKGELSAHLLSPGRKPSKSSKRSGSKTKVSRSASSFDMMSNKSLSRSRHSSRQMGLKSKQSSRRSRSVRSRGRSYSRSRHSSRRTSSVRGRSRSYSRSGHSSRRASSVRGRSRSYSRSGHSSRRASSVRSSSRSFSRSDFSSRGSRSVHRRSRSFSRSDRSSRGSRSVHRRSRSFSRSGHSSRRSRSFHSSASCYSRSSYSGASSYSRSGQWSGTSYSRSGDSRYYSSRSGTSRERSRKNSRRKSDSHTSTESTEVLISRCDGNSFFKTFEAIQEPASVVHLDVRSGTSRRSRSASREISIESKKDSSSGDWSDGVKHGSKSDRSKSDLDGDASDIPISKGSHKSHLSARRSSRRSKSNMSLSVEPKKTDSKETVNENQKETDEEFSSDDDRVRTDDQYSDSEFPLDDPSTMRIDKRTGKVKKRKKTLVKKKSKKSDRQIELPPLRGGLTPSGNSGLNVGALPSITMSRPSMNSADGASVLLQEGGTPSRNSIARLSQGVSSTRPSGLLSNYSFDYPMDGTSSALLRQEGGLSNFSFEIPMAGDSSTTRPTNTARNIIEQTRQLQRIPTVQILENLENGLGPQQDTLQLPLQNTNNSILNMEGMLQAPEPPQIDQEQALPAGHLQPNLLMMNIRSERSAFRVVQNNGNQQADAQIAGQQDVDQITSQNYMRPVQSERNNLLGDLPPLVASAPSIVQGQEVLVDDVIDGILGNDDNTIAQDGESQDGDSLQNLENELDE
uniref:Uncharacterized protein n=1 Tax=Clytia hemisphaerica TaxID=252671 RepID=A0A7M5UZZ1_9CNID